MLINFPNSTFASQNYENFLKVSTTLPKTPLTMVLISRSQDAIPYAVRVLGENSLQGMYVQTGSSSWVHIGSVRESIITYYVRQLITKAEYDHYITILAAVYEGYYFDTRFKLYAMGDPAIRMNIVIFLEEYGDVYPRHPDGALVEDLTVLHHYDDILWERFDGQTAFECIPDEHFRPDVSEIVDLTNDDVEDDVYDQAPAFIWDNISLSDISVMSDIENIDPDWDIREAFEPPTGFE